MILDIGCGQGKVEGSIGLDRSQYTDCDIVADAHHLPFVENIFGRIHLHLLLEHVESPFYVLKEVNRVLSEDGYIFLSVPNLHLEAIIFLLLNKEFHQTRDHISRWTRGEMRNLLSKTGFVITRFGYRRETKLPLINRFAPPWLKEKIQVFEAKLK